VLDAKWVGLMPEATHQTKVHENQNFIGRQTLTRVQAQSLLMDVLSHQRQIGLTPSRNLVHDSSRFGDIKDESCLI
jgi:hypothetical protein